MLFFQDRVCVLLGLVAPQMQPLARMPVQLLASHCQQSIRQQPPPLVS